MSNCGVTGLQISITTKDNPIVNFVGITTTYGMCENDCYILVEYKDGDKYCIFRGDNIKIPYNINNEDIYKYLKLSIFE